MPKRVLPALLAMLIIPCVAHGRTVRMIFLLNSYWNNVDVELYDSAPITCQNFLDYVNSGSYDLSMIHRSVLGFILQGGAVQLVDTGQGYSTLQMIPTYDPIVNEFSPDRSNVEATIAMAKVAGDPNSATSQFFFNMADNSSALDTQNGGFTVFGHVTAGYGALQYYNSLNVIDGTQLGWSNLPLNEMPVGDTYTSGNFTIDDVVWVYSAYVITDANNDGVVDAADYVAMKENMGTTAGATWEQGDFNGDGAVDEIDLSLLDFCLAQNVQFPVGAVPEPASAALLLLGGAGVLLRRNHRRCTSSTNRLPRCS